MKTAERLGSEEEEEEEVFGQGEPLTARIQSKATNPTTK